MFDSNKEMENYLRNRDKNLALILEYLAKNAPFFASIGHPVSDNQKSISLLTSNLDKQCGNLDSMKENLNRWITASIKGTELDRERLNTILSAQEKLNQHIESVSSDVKELSKIVEKLCQFQTKTSTVLEFLVSPILSETTDAPRQKSATKS